MPKEKPSWKYNCKARVTTTDGGDIIVTNNEHCHTGMDYYEKHTSFAKLPTGFSILFRRNSSTFTKRLQNQQVKSSIEQQQQQHQQP